MYEERVDDICWYYHKSNEQIGKRQGEYKPVGRDVKSSSRIACVQTSPISFASIAPISFSAEAKEIGDVCTQAIRVKMRYITNVTPTKTIKIQYQ